MNDLNAADDLLRDSFALLEEAPADEVRAAHLAAARAALAEPRSPGGTVLPWRRRARLPARAAAAVVLFVFVGGWLGASGSLPAAAQDAVSSVAFAAGLHVPMSAEVALDRELAALEEDDRQPDDARDPEALAVREAEREQLAERRQAFRDEAHERARELREACREELDAADDRTERREIRERCRAEFAALAAEISEERQALHAELRPEGDRGERRERPDERADSPRATEDGQRDRDERPTTRDERDERLLDERSEDSPTRSTDSGADDGREDASVPERTRDAEPTTQERADRTREDRDERERTRTPDRHREQRVGDREP